MTVSGGGLSRVFQVDTGVTASISGLTITGGNAVTAVAAAWPTTARLTLTDCTVSGNSAATYGGGLATTAARPR